MRICCTAAGPDRRNIGDIQISIVKARAAESADAGLTKYW